MQPARKERHRLKSGPDDVSKQTLAVGTTKHRLLG